MKKLFLLATPLMLLVTSLSAVAQETPKMEMFGGYSYLRTHPGDGIDSIGAHGFNTSAVGNLTKNIGIVGEFSRFTKSETIDLSSFFNQPGVGTGKAKARTLTFLFGPRLTLRSKKMEPFVHGLLGGANTSVKSSVLGFSGDASDTTFAFALGGGVDYKLSDRVAVRLGQLDYLRTGVRDQGINNFRYSAGIVIRMGKR